MTEENRKEFLKRIIEEARLLRDLENTSAKINFLEKTSKDVKDYFKLKAHLKYADNNLSELQREPLISGCKHEIYVYLGKKDLDYYDLGIAQVYKCLDCGEEEYFYDHPDADKERFNKFKESHTIINKVGYLFDEIQTDYYNSLISNDSEEAKKKVLEKYYKKNK